MLAAQDAALPASYRPDVAVVIVGGNDVTHRVPVAVAVQHLAECVRAAGAGGRGGGRDLPGPGRAAAGAAAAAGPGIARLAAARPRPAGGGPAAITAIPSCSASTAIFLMRLVFP